MKKPRSLKRALVVYPLVFHFATLIVAFAVLVSVALRIDSGGPYTDEQITSAIARAIERDQTGRLVVMMTPELEQMRTETPTLWFVAEDSHGQSVSLGEIPPFYQSFVGRLSDLSYAHMRDSTPPYELAAVVRREQTDIGELTILGHGALSELSFIVLMATNTIAIPIFLMLVLTSLIVTPWIVKRSLSGVVRVARETEGIDIDSRGRRLNIQDVPREVLPLIRAVNQALARLDDGYERQRRFIASASHELRTPIAILQSKIESSTHQPVQELGQDVYRLATLTEQLLDLERLQDDTHFKKLDLSSLVRNVVGELAPLVISKGGTIEVQVVRSGDCYGDRGALERVIMNLVQNAVDHGGRSVTVRVDGPNFEVEDDGPGIPPDERESVFEPFHRLRPRQTGSGLGLNLVKEIISRHRGRVQIREGSRGGALIRVQLSGV